MDLVESLFAAMIEVEPYPQGVVKVPGRLPGVAFFPGGCGLYTEGDGPFNDPGTTLVTMPVGGVMLVAQDFNTLAEFDSRLKERIEVCKVRDRLHSVSRVMKNLLPLLELPLRDAKISLKDCFFTNAFMGLRVAGPATGPFPGWRNAGFVERCRRFFLRQLSAQRPRLVLTLGKWVRKFLGPLSPELRPWKEARSFKDVDAAGSVIHNAAFPGADIPACSVVALTHPSVFNPNVRHRHFRELKGRDAEVAMIREALKVAKPAAPFVPTAAVQA